MTGRKTSTKSATRTHSAADPRVGKLLSALRTNPRLAPTVAAYEKDADQPGRRFGKNGLKTRAGKLFALFTQNTLVVKLPNERVAALVEDGVAPGPLRWRCCASPHVTPGWSGRTCGPRHEGLKGLARAGARRSIRLG